MNWVERRSERRAKALAEFLFKRPRCIICNGPITKMGARTDSRECAVKFWNWFKRPTRRGRVAVLRTCPVCATPIAPEMRHGTIYCGKPCRDHARYMRLMPKAERHCSCAVRIDPSERRSTKYCSKAHRDASWNEKRRLAAA